MRYFWLGREVDLPGAAELVEQVDVIGAHVHLQGVEDALHVHAQLLTLSAVDIHIELGSLGAVDREHVDQRRGLRLRLGGLTRLGDHLVGRFLQFGQVHEAALLDLQFEAGGVAQALDRRGPEHGDEGAVDLLTGQAAEPGGDGGVVLLVLALAVGERLQGDEGGAEVRGVGAQQERRAGDAQHVRRARDALVALLPLRRGRSPVQAGVVAQDDPLDLRQHGRGALHAGGVGQLDVDQQIALVLIGDEALGRRRHVAVRQEQQPAVQQQHDHAHAQQAANRPAVQLRDLGENPVEAPEERAEHEIDRPDDEPAEHPAGERPGQERQPGGGVEQPFRGQLELRGVGRRQPQQRGDVRLAQPDRDRAPEQREGPPRQCLALHLVTALAGLLRLEDGHGARRGQRHGVDRGNHHRRGDGQGELAVELADEARQERGRQEHGDQHQGDGEDRAGDLAHRLDGGRPGVQSLGNVVLDVLQHDDGVIDHDADGQHQPEQCQAVQAEAHQRHDGEGADQRHRHVDHGQDHRLPVLQEQAAPRSPPG